MWYRIQNEKIQFFIKVKPNAKKNEFSGIHDNYLKVSLHALPVEGAANQELIAFLAKSFRIPKSQINILQGEVSCFKKVELPYIDAIKEFVLKFM